MASSSKRNRDEESPLVREDSTKQPINSSLVRTTEEVSFPRGGASALTPLELKQVANEAASDVLFGNETKKSKTESQAPKETSRPKKKKKTTKASGEAADESDSDIDADNLAIIQHVTFKNLNIGSQLLGQISSITKNDLCVTFTDGISGYVSITNISDQFTAILEDLDESMEDSSDIQKSDDEEYESADESEKRAASTKEQPHLKNFFTVGNWLRCSVTANSALDTQSKKTKKRRIELTIEPSVVNKFTGDDLNKFTSVQCSVKSIEDHGAILDLGIKNFTGFLAKKDHPSFEKLQPGCVFLANIAKKSDRTIAVNFNFAIKNNKVTHISSIDAVVPGQVVDFLCEQISSSGIVGKVFGHVSGFMSDVQLKTFSEEEIKHKFAIGSNVQGRIIASLNNKEGEKVLLVSTLNHIVTLDTSLNDIEQLEAFPVGFTFTSSNVKGRDSTYLYLALDEDRTGQVHNSKIGSALESEKISARVLGFNSIDNLFQLSTDPETLKMKYLRATDIKIGELLSNCEVTSVSTDGINLKVFGGQFTAFVPSLHISDTRLVYPERKFKIGSKVRGRVLNVNLKGHIFVTLKKSFVNLEDDNEDLSMVSSYKTAEEVQKKNKKTTATVQVFKPNGCVISFFGGITGFLPNSEISEAFVKKPEEHLRLGQTVIVKLLQVDPSKTRIIVTCKVSNDKAELQKEIIEQLIPGRSMVEVSVIEKTKDSIVVEMVSSGLRGVLYVGHLSDSKIEQCRAEIKKVRIGSKLNGLVIDKDARTQVFNMTLKASLIKDSQKEKLPLSYADIKSNDKTTPLHGYIKSVSDKGVFVAFNGKFVGLVLPSYAVENREVDILKAFQINQSVTANLLRTDDDQERFLLTLNTSTSKDTKKSNTDTAAINPIDSSIKSLSDFTVGRVIQGKIKGVKKNQLNIILADNLHGRVDVAEVFDNYESIKDSKQPLSSFKSGNIVTVKIMGQHDIKSHKFLPITHSAMKNSVLELTMKPSELKKSQTTSMTIKDISVGDEITGYVNNYGNNIIWLTVSPLLKAKLSLFEVSDDGSKVSEIEDSFPLSSALKVHVTSIDLAHNFVTVSNKSRSVKNISDIKVNDTLPARIIKVTEKFVLLDLGNKITGISFITDALDDYSVTLHEAYEHKMRQMVSATVLSVDAESKKINLSLRSKDASPTIASHDDIKQGKIVYALVKAVTDKGIFVYLSTKLDGFVPVSKLSDSYLKDWKKFYKPMQYVVGKVVSCEEDSRVLLTLRESEVNGDLKVLKGYSDIQVGETFHGNIKNVTDFGVFVKLDNTLNVTGLAHRTEIADSTPDDLSKLFGVGDRVKAIVLKVNPEKKQMSLGLKASYFSNSDEFNEVVPESDVDELMDAVDYNNNSDDESDVEVEQKKTKNVPMSTDGLSLSADFDWTANVLDQAQSEEDSDADEEDFTQSKRSKNKKKRSTFVEDKTIDVNTRAPESIGDFERLIMGNPNSSVIWMNYMAFQLQLSEIDKAREISERALKTINFRDEAEKLNIWIAMLNLENTFGSEESLDDVFKRACQYMDSYTIFTRLLSIYQMSEKYDRASELFKVTAKKFGSEKVSIWVSWGDFLISNRQAQEARTILSNALKALPKRDHIEVVRKFAQLEFAKGDNERGRSLFEGLIADAAKRIDIWNVYIDQEIKAGNKKKVEDLFERVILRKVTRKQAKFFFNKWLQFEETHKDEKAVGYVKAKAAEFVESHQKVSETD